MGREIQSFDSALALAADQRLDAAWGGFRLFLQGWVRAPFEGEASELGQHARRLLESVYPEGLKFTQLPDKLPWAESDTRVARLGQRENVEKIGALGAEVFVELLRKAHAAYGEALNITSARAELKAKAGVREPLDAFVEALRVYATIVVAQGADRVDDAGGARSSTCCLRRS